MIYSNSYKFDAMNEKQLHNKFRLLYLMLILVTVLDVLILIKISHNENKINNIGENIVKLQFGNK